MLMSPRKNGLDSLFKEVAGFSRKGDTEKGTAKILSYLVVFCLLSRFAQRLSVHSSRHLAAHAVRSLQLPGGVRQARGCHFGAHSGWAFSSCPKQRAGNRAPQLSWRPFWRERVAFLVRDLSGTPLCAMLVCAHRQPTMALMRSC